MTVYGVSDSTSVYHTSHLSTLYPDKASSDPTNHQNLSNQTFLWIRYSIPNHCYLVRPSPLSLFSITGSCFRFWMPFIKYSIYWEKGGMNLALISIPNMIHVVLVSSLRHYPSQSPISNALALSQLLTPNSSLFQTIQCIITPFSLYYWIVLVTCFHQLVIMWWWMYMMLTFCWESY